ncbi:MAG: hypothetical protein ACREX4_15330 [Gammaproteobacteria bacterium]
MITRKLQGRAPSLRDQQRALLARARPSAYCAVDFDALRDDLNSRVFVGPPTPLHLMRQMQPAVAADRVQARHWQLVAEFNRYGYCEFKQRGTPFVGDAFGCGQ